jgi:hypothetical protein
MMWNATFNEGEIFGQLLKLFVDTYHVRTSGGIIATSEGRRMRAPDRMRRPEAAAAAGFFTI